MANMFDYVSWRGDLEFDLIPFNPVDNIVFSQLSYLPMDGIVQASGKGNPVSVSALAKMYMAKHGGNPSASKDITVARASSTLSAISMAPRYEDCEVFGYVNNTDPGTEKQFSAFCVIIGRKRSSRKLVVVFRGTDTSIVGWKEDLNMSLVNSIPSQEEAVSYLEEMANCHSYPLIVAGHSKGGNLAMYASAFCNEAIQRRIIAVYSNDAPGFHQEIIQRKGYRAICGRIQAFVPQSSFVGILLEHAVSPKVIKSTAIGLMQHDLRSWEVTRDDLADGGELTPQSRFIHSIITEWIGKIGDERRYQFIEALYKILVSSNATSFAEMGSDWSQSAAGIISGLKNVDGPTKKLMGEIIGELLKTASKNIIGQRKRSNGKDDSWTTDLFSEE
ncbi:MAG: DUF2974 domain-containing protein [Treponema sp.]|nr:DUF2974 domain-containing protein [Treponema sp.]